MQKQHFLHHEEVLADYLRQAQPHGLETIEMPIRRRSLQLFLFGAMAVLVFFGLRIFSLTVLKGELFSNAADRSRERTIVLSGVRGAILDRTGTILVQNAPAFALVFDPLAARATPPEDAGRAFALVSRATGRSEDELRALTEPFRDQAEPRAIIADVPREAALALLASDLPSMLRIEPTFRRDYPLRNTAAFAHVIGYVGAVSEEDLSGGKRYAPHDRIGKAGVERFYDEELRGIPGRRTVTIDARGKPQGEAEVLSPVDGMNLQLTIDAGLTETAYDALRRAVVAAHATGGALVALDPRDGSIRALTSVPAYDPAPLSAGTIAPQDYARLAEDARKPFLNRAVAGLYPAGSTLKPFIASAARAESIISPERRIDASKGYIRVTSIYDPNISWTFRDWKPHGFVNMVEAIARSSDVYFYTVGGGYGDIAGLGPERIARYLSAFGFGKTLGIDLPAEAAGRIPTPSWKKETLGEQWFIGDTYNLSIGQGAFAATPLQLAVATAALANGGTLWRPHVLDAVVASDGSRTRHIDGEPLGNIPVAPEDLQIVRRGMRLSVTSPAGTNRLLADLPVAVAAKTGTAQFGTEGKTHALVTAFAPYEEPELALAIVLEGGGEGTVASAVAKEVLAWYATHRLERNDR